MLAGSMAEDGPSVADRIAKLSKKLAKAKAAEDTDKVLLQPHSHAPCMTLADVLCTLTGCPVYQEAGQAAEEGCLSGTSTACSCGGKAAGQEALKG
jgi:hypothetical protein